MSPRDVGPDPPEPKTVPIPNEPPREPDEGGYRCDLCGATMREWLCRIVCPNCGYQRDCEDP